MRNPGPIKQVFQDMFGGPPEFVVRAPGRVNLIGEHTDYNDGFVFPAAIDRDVAIAGVPRSDRQVRLYSQVFGQSATFSLDDITPSDEAPWSDYVRGVASVLREEGYPLRGMSAVVAGTVPIASGLSSSAAMEVSSCCAFEAAGAFDIEPVQRAVLALRAEQEFVGVHCGIMDMFISALGRKDHALFIDTRSFAYQAVPLPHEEAVIVVSDTGKRRGLVESEYNTRRAECEQAVAILRHSLPDARTLRDVSIVEFEEHASSLPETVRMRARHVISENARVLESVEALKSGNVARFGELMNASHVSLRDDYAVSCPELDALVDAAWRVPGVFGSRMTGAGFGGCTVTLVHPASVDRFIHEVGETYGKVTGLNASIYVCHASDGAGRDRDER